MLQKFTWTMAAVRPRPGQLFVLLFTIVLLVTAIVVLARGSPTKGRVFGLSATGSDVTGLAAVAETGRAVDHRVDVVNFYVAWTWRSALPVQMLNAIGASGSRPEITWEPWDPREGVDQPEFSLAAIAGGSYDSYITGWAQQAAAYGKPILLRFAHEMNGTWYPWSVLRNGGSPAAYVRAYRHVHDIFAAAGADKVQWVWSPNVIGQESETALTDSFPGAEFVDVIGVDGYNFGSTSEGQQTRGWITPEALFGPTLAILRRLPAIPIWINETGCSATGGDVAAWIADLFGYLTRNGVTGLMWFELPVPDHPALRLAGTPATKQAATAGLSQW